jgi:nitric oxide reductase NorE protein
MDSDKATFSSGLSGIQEGTRGESAGIWTFVVIDCASFAMLFLVFMIARSQQRALFAASAAQLDVALGLLNTVILLTSGWLVARATASAQIDDRQATFRNLTMALASGALFGVVKVIEYWRKICVGVNPLSNDFFGYYFILTGIHFVHYIAGLAVLSWLVWGARRQDNISGSQYFRFLEGGAIYWHLVDLLWMFLFPMLYLQGQ